MIVTALIDNTRLAGRSDLCTENGLSLHIQRNGAQLLFDTGATEAFAQNAERLGIDIRAVDMAIISHYHFDHGGGLAHFLETNHTAKVCLRRWDAGDCYLRAFAIVNRFVGLDRALFQKHAERFVFVDGFAEISPGVFIVTKVGSLYPQPKGNRYLFVKEDATCQLDRFGHESVVVIQEQEGLVALTGCSHQGILNMVAAVTWQFDGLPIKAVFGGFHLAGLPKLNLGAESRREVEAIGKELLRYPVERVYTGHCTGTRAYRILEAVMGDKLAALSAGSHIEI